MWNAGGKIPDVADADIVQEVASLLVNRADAGAPVEHIGPLCFLVPVQLAHAAGIQTHIHACQRRRDRQLAHGHLPRPASLLQPIVREGERKFQVGEGASVSAGWGEDIGILSVQQYVSRARIGCTSTVPDRLWHLIACFSALVKHIFHACSPLFIPFHGMTVSSQGSVVGEAWPAGRWQASPLHFCLSHQVSICYGKAIAPFATINTLPSMTTTRHESVMSIVMKRCHITLQKVGTGR